jgi:hypothetical protein
MKHRLLASILAATFLALGMDTITAMAATTTAQVSIQPGALSVTAPTIKTAFPTVTLNGQPQQVNATLNNWTVIDATGTSDGWHVQLSASRITEVTPSGGWAPGTSAQTLPQGSLALSGSRSITAGTGSTPVDGTNGPLLQNESAAIDTSTPVTIVDAKPGYGMGTYTIVEPSNGLTLSLQPSSTYTDTTNYPTGSTPYQTTLTYSVVSGP